MSFLAPPVSTSASRRKSTSDLFRGMTVAKALAILKLTQREYAELSDERFRETFAKRQEAESAAKEVLSVASKKAINSRPDLKHWQPPPPLVDHKKMMEKSMKKHEAFQFLVKKRSVTKERQRSHDSSCSESLPRSPSTVSWGSQDLSDIGDTASPAAKRRGSVLEFEYYSRGPMMVGPGTPPPILMPGVDPGADEDDPGEGVAPPVVKKVEVTGKTNTKKWKSQKKLTPIKVQITKHQTGSLSPDKFGSWVGSRGKSNFGSAKTLKAPGPSTPH